MQSRSKPAPAIIYAGTADFAIPPLQALIEAGAIPVAVLTQPDRPAGRGRKLTPSPVKRLALEFGIPAIQPVRTDEAVGQLQECKPDLMVVAAYGQILSRQVLALPRLGCVNIHASLLPRWRGAAPVARAIEAGDTETGVTLMQMDEGLDTGDILDQAVMPIGARETAGQLHDRLAQLGADLLGARLEQLGAGILKPRPQPAAGVTYAHKLSRQEALLDWRLSATELARKIRAFHPWPAASTRYQNEVIKIHSAHPLERRHGEDPGTITEAGGTVLAVACGEGVLTLDILQRSGGKPLAAADFLNGFRMARGERFTGMEPE